MKRMTANAFVFGNISKRPKKYLALLLGVVLSMVFSSGTLFFLSCLSSSRAELKRQRFGYADTFAIQLTEENVRQLKEENPGVTCGFARVLGFVFTGEESDGACAVILDETAERLYDPALISGRMPEGAGEIAVEQDALFRLDLENAALGDKLPLSLRVNDDTEYSETVVEKTYTLTGILTDKRTYMENNFEFSRRIPAVFFSEKETVEPGGRAGLSAYIQKDPKQPHGLVLNASATALTDDFSFLTAKTGSMGFFAGMLALASGIGIANTLHAVYRERKKQTGLLRAVGATRRQIVSIYARETLLLILLSAPVSLLISYFGVKLIVGRMENVYFLPSWGVLLGSVGVGVLFTLAASLIPLLSASRVSPMQAIGSVELRRRMQKLRLRSKTRFSVPALLTSRSLRFYRGRTALTALILAGTIFLSCFAFTFFDVAGAHTVADYHVQVLMDLVGIPYVNYRTQQVGFTENDKSYLRSGEHIAVVKGRAEANCTVVSEDDSDYLRLMRLRYAYFVYDPDRLLAVTQQNFKELENFPNAAWTDFLSKTGLPAASVHMKLTAQNESDIALLSESVAEGKIDIAKLNSGEEIILLAPASLSALYSYGHMEVFEVRDPAVYQGRTILETAQCPFHAGDRLTVTTVDAAAPTADGALPETYKINTKTVTVGAIVRDVYYTYIPSGGEFGVITTDSGLRQFTDAYVYKFLDANADVPVTKELDSAIMRRISRITSGVSSMAESQYEQAQQAREQRRQLTAAVSGVAILLLSIAGSLICNALTARIADGKRAIGTLRAVGASRKTLIESYARELLWIFGVGIVSGFAGFLLFDVGLGVYEWLVHYTLTPIIHRPVLWHTALFVLLLFGVCALHLWRLIARETKYSIVENIREL